MMKHIFSILAIILCISYLAVSCMESPDYSQEIASLLREKYFTQDENLQDMIGIARGVENNNEDRLNQLEKKNNRWRCCPNADTRKKRVIVAQFIRDEREKRSGRVLEDNLAKGVLLTMQAKQPFQDACDKHEQDIA